MLCTHNRIVTHGDALPINGANNSEDSLQFFKFNLGSDLMTTKTKKAQKKESEEAIGLQIESLRPALDEIERMIAYARQDMGFLDIRITPVIQTQGQRNCYGFFTFGEIWQTTEGKGSHEIQISAEHLARPAIDIYATVRHELVHARNFECGIKDCSNGGRYHNAKFKSSAESYGLVCGDKTASNGHGVTTLDPVYAAQVLAELQPDDNAFTLARQIQAKKAKKPKDKTKMLKWSCACTNIRAAVEVHAICSACGDVFEKI
jgi:hypothetical protein